MKENRTILLHNITPEEFKASLMADLQIVIEGLLQISKAEKPLEYLTRKEVSEILKISLVTLGVWNKKGVLKPYRIGNLVRYKSNEIDKALTEIYRRKN